MLDRGDDDVAESRSWARPWLVLIVGLWLIAWPSAEYQALTSDWAPSGEVPTAAQVSAALSNARSAAVVGIALPALGCAVAAWCRLRLTAGLLAAGTAAAALLSLMVVGLAR